MQTQPQQLLAFVLDGDRYCADLERVSEVVENHGVTPLPNSPPEVLGVTDLRGETMRVLDPRGPLGLDGEAKGDRIVVTRPEDAPVGWLVDAVEDVVATGDLDVATDDDDEGARLVDLAGLAADYVGGGPAPPSAGPTQLLELGLEDGRYAVPLDAVAEIGDAGDVTPTDDGPATVGETTVADRPVLVIDPKAAYGIDGDPTGDRLVVLDRRTDDGRHVGWLADAVHEVIRPAPDAVEGPGPDVAGVAAVVRLEDRFVTWLDPDAAP